ncbi:MAG TPA: hypothetical protein DCR55_14510 [Lentisphaeria bacterium]|nr:hypothetical protein [Lentisphaeria bacterium]
MNSSTIVLLIVGVTIAIWCRTCLEALSRISWVTIRKESFKRTGLSDLAEAWLESRDLFQSTLRFFISVSLCLSAAIAYPAVQQNLPREASPFTLVLLTAFLVTVAFYALIEVVVLGGFARSNPVLMHVAAPMLRALGLIQPILQIINQRGRSENGEEEETTLSVEDEIIHLVEQDAHSDDQSSELEDSERRMIRGIFDLDETLVKEIMTPRVDMDVLRADVDMREAKKKIVECGHSRIPVYGTTVDDIQGVVYAKDFLDESRMGGSEDLLALSHKPLFVPESKNVRDLLDDFKRSNIHFAVIIDEYGGTAGIVTFEDILEEIVGEIRDEYDDEEELAFDQQEDGSYVIDARTPVGTVNEFLKSDISEEEDYDTIGGFVISKFGRIPAVGELIEVDGLAVTILDANERCVGQIAVKQLTLEKSE